MIRVTHNIVIPDEELDWQFVRASGPGGQNVNKVSTAVQLRFRLRDSRVLPPAVRRRAEHLAGQRLTTDGVLIIDARRYRSQSRNREDAVVRLRQLLLAALRPPKRRRPTAVPGGVRRERLELKREQAQRKRLRQRPPEGAEG